MNVPILILLLILFTDIATSPASASADEVRPLSREQQLRLAGGEVLFLDVLPPGGDVKSSQGGTAMALVHSTADTVWRVLVDYPRHSGLYPHVTRAEVVEANESRALVKYVVGIGPLSFHFHVKNFPDVSSYRLVWRLDPERRNDLFRDSWGYWLIEPGPRGVLLTYAMAARTVLPAFVTRGSERDGVVETLKAVRDRAEHTP